MTNGSFVCPLLSACSIFLHSHVVLQKRIVSFDVLETNSICRFCRRSIRRHKPHSRAQHRGRSLGWILLREADAFVSPRVRCQATLKFAQRCGLVCNYAVVNETAMPKAVLLRK